MVPINLFMFSLSNNSNNLNSYRSGRSDSTCTIQTLSQFEGPANSAMGLCSISTEHVFAHIHSCTHTFTLSVPAVADSCAPETPQLLFPLILHKLYTEGAPTLVESIVNITYIHCTRAILISF